MTNRQWIKAIIKGERDIPIAQQWMSFFNAQVAKELTPAKYHYESMWLYDTSEEFDMSAIGDETLDRMIQFNNYTGRCMSCLGRGANIAWGHGGPGEFFAKTIERTEEGLIVEYETGVRAKISFQPHFYHSYNHPVKTVADLEKLTLPDAAAADRYEGFARDAQYLKAKGQYVVASLNGFFSGIHYFLIDYQQTLMNMILEPDLINRATEILGSWNITAARKMIEVGADCIALCDDLGSKENLLFAPDKYRTFFKPWHKKLCQTAHEMGAQVHLHSHGGIVPLLDDLADCGFDFINPFDADEGFDIEWILKTYADKFVVVGGIPTSFWSWDAQRQRSHLERIASLARKYGSFIFMDAGGVPENIKRSDFERILQVSREVRSVEGVYGAV